MKKKTVDRGGGWLYSGMAPSMPRAPHDRAARAVLKILLWVSASLCLRKRRSLLATWFHAPALASRLYSRASQRRSFAVRHFDRACRMGCLGRIADDPLPRRLLTGTVPRTRIAADHRHSGLGVPPLSHWLFEGPLRHSPWLL